MDPNAVSSVDRSRGNVVPLRSRGAGVGPHVGQPNVNAKASTPGSRNSISNTRSTIGRDWRISWYNRCSATTPLAARISFGALSERFRRSLRHLSVGRVAVVNRRARSSERVRAKDVGGAVGP